MFIVDFVDEKAFCFISYYFYFICIYSISCIQKYLGYILCFYYIFLILVASFGKYTFFVSIICSRNYYFVVVFLYCYKTIEKHIFVLTLLCCYVCTIVVYIFVYHLCVWFCLHGLLCGFTIFFYFIEWRVLYIFYLLVYYIHQFFN